MMKCKWFNSDKTYSLEDFDILTVVIENKPMLMDYMRYLHNDFRGKERYWRFLKGMDPVDTEDVADFVPDIFSLDINSKKNINALYKLLKKQYYEQLSNDIALLKGKAVEIVKEISVDFDLELTATSDIKEDDLFKIMDLRFDSDELDEKEKFIKYCQVIYELRGVQLFFVVSMHQYFSEDDLKQIVEELKYRHIKLFNVETVRPIAKIGSEILFLIDADLCVIE